MSEPRSQRIVILKRAITDSVDRAAAELRRDFADGRPQARARIDVPGVPPLHFHLLRPHGDSSFRIEFDQSFAPCAACRQTISEDLRRYDGADRLHLFLREAVQTWHACDCFPGRRAAGAQGQQSRQPEPQGGWGGRVRVGATRPAPGVESPAREFRALQPRRETRGAAGDRESLAWKDSGAGARAAAELVYELPESKRMTLLLTAEFATALAEHCGESNRHGYEVGGMVVGYANEAQSQEAPGGEFYLMATDALPFRATESSHAHLHMDADAWLHIGELIDSEFTPQGKVRLGWYHTHPTQGVLFSERDLDTHTNFRQPHQFALVLDPRTMESGLYFWADQPRRRLGEPVHFVLPVRAGAASSPPQPLRAQEAGESRRAGGEQPAALRALTCVALVAALAGYLTYKSFKVALTPNEACALALAVLIGLRLWNVGAFHYRPHLEGRAARSLGRLGRRGYAALLDMLSEVPRSLLLGFILVLVLVICAMLLYPRLGSLVGRAPRDTQQEARPDASAQSSTREAPARKSVRLALKEKKENAGTTVELTNPSFQQQPVVYEVRGGEGGETVALRSSPAEEAQLVNNTFDKPQVIALQRALGVQTTDSNTGTWGQQTRTAFVLKARESKAAGRPLEAELTDHGLLVVDFK